MSLTSVSGQRLSHFRSVLLSWVSHDIFFNDGGVIKAVLRECSSWKKPSMEVMKGVAIVNEMKGFEYTVGDGSLGPLETKIGKTLSDRLKGEEAQLKCSPDYAHGATIDGTLFSYSRIQSPFKTRHAQRGPEKYRNICCECTIMELSACVSLLGECHLGCGRMQREQAKVAHYAKDEQVPRHVPDSD